MKPLLALATAILITTPAQATDPKQPHQTLSAHKKKTRKTTSPRRHATKAQTPRAASANSHKTKP